MQNLLYSFRRCPYAIRARMSLIYSKISFEIIEVDLKNKPKELIKISPKGTVPVLQTSQGEIIDESLDIIHWALKISDPNQWAPQNALEEKNCQELISVNDNHFKYFLDRFKYPNRYEKETNAKDKVEEFLYKLNNLLTSNQFLITDRITITDVA
ncbi:MAG: glutathione S-transferase N-terminal domain-containing protein, partial [Legionellales bacterium]|nr:glutathione S-transferase N-terminal domain-containing protein [Legionellales bacterium]